MKRLLALVACFALAAPLLAEKRMRILPHAPSPQAPATATINGSPLTIVVGDDTSTQVYNSNVPGTGQFFPPDCSPGETADNGIFISVGANVYGPDFDNHPCGSASNSYIPWAPVSFSGVTGTGTAGDPFTVVIVVDAVQAGITLTETLTYVNGAPQANISLVFSLIPVPAAPEGGIQFNAFQGADLYLADNDSGYGLLQGTSAGGRGANGSCTALSYTILLLGTTPANRWSATGYGTVWDEISAANLSDTVDSAICEDNGAGLEWTNLVIVQGTLTINTGISFTGTATPLGAAVPALSPKALAALVLLLAAAGYVLARKASPGA